jgi:hypothetical protein
MRDDSASEPLPKASSQILENKRAEKFSGCKILYLNDLNIRILKAKDLLQIQLSRRTSGMKKLG